MPNDTIINQYTVYDLGYAKNLIKDDAFYNEINRVAPRIENQVNPALVGAGEYGSNTVLASGSYQSSNYVAGSAGWALLPTLAEFNDVTVRGILVAGQIHIPDQNTTANSFHVQPDGDTWWGCTENNFNADPDNAKAYVLKSGVGKFQDITITGGVIANWTISTTAISTGLFDTLNTMYFGTSGLSLSNVFKVTAAGAITATSGAIGGWTLGATTLSATGIILDAGNQKIQVGATAPITIDGATKKIESDNYVSGVFGAGFHLDSNLLEVGNVAVRGLIRTAVFQKDVVSVMGGNFAVLDGDVLDADMTALDASTLTTKANTTFAIGDILRIKDGVNDEWMEVVNIGSAPVYTVTRDKASAYAPNTNPTWKKGATIVNYKQSGDGGIYMTASETNAPYLSIFDHTGSPWSTINTRLRIGNLNGFLGYSADLYGIAIGETDKYLKYDPSNGMRIKGTVLITSGSSGVANLSDAGALALLSVIGNAYITDLAVDKLTAGTISSKAITLAIAAGTGDSYIAAGKTDFDNTQSGFILGLDDSDSDKAKFYIGNATDYFNFNGSNVVFRTTLADAITIDYGSNVLLKEGGSVKFTSVTAPGACTATLVTTGTGNVDNGTHSYRVVFVTATGETQAGTASNVVTVDATHKQVDLSSIPVSSSGAVTSRKIYRTKAGGSIYFLLTTINNNTATTYTDNIADASLTADGNVGTKDNNSFGKVLVDGNTVMSIGSWNTFVGQGAGDSVRSGYANSFFGASAGRSITQGDFNVAVGLSALFSNTTGNQNTAIGLEALYKNTVQSYNVAIGSSALHENVGTGAYGVNTAIGTSALYSLATGTYNTAIGGWALANGLTTGDRNVAIGYAAGYYETGSDKLFIDNAERADEADGRAKALIYGIFAAAPANQKLTINGLLNQSVSKTPASAAATGAAGDICWDANYIYVCVATDTWKRVGIATW